MNIIAESQMFLKRLISCQSFSIIRQCCHPFKRSYIFKKICIFQLEICLRKYGVFWVPDVKGYCKPCTKSESHNGGDKKTKHIKFSEKTNISYPLIRTLKCAYKGVRNVYFSENLACFDFLPPF